MAEAVENLFPGVKFWVGPPLEKGFYYDIDPGNDVIGEEDLKNIELKMAELETSGTFITGYSYTYFTEG